MKYFNLQNNYRCKRCRYNLRYSVHYDYTYYFLLLGMSEWSIWLFRTCLVGVNTLVGVIQWPFRDVAGDALGFPLWSTYTFRFTLCTAFRFNFIPCFTSTFMLSFNLRRTFILIFRFDSILILCLTISFKNNKWRYGYSATLVEIWVIKQNVKLWELKTEPVIIRPLVRIIVSTHARSCFR